jgi:hypothetical protein
VKDWRGPNVAVLSFLERVRLRPAWCGLEGGWRLGLKGEEGSEACEELCLRVRLSLEVI